MKYNVPERVIRDITRIARKNNVEKIILFGSRARGDHTERSDIDLAVSGGDFDKGISDELKKEIERDGIIVYEKA